MKGLSAHGHAFFARIGRPGLSRATPASADCCVRQAANQPYADREPLSFAVTRIALPASRPGLEARGEPGPGSNSYAAAPRCPSRLSQASVSSSALAKRSNRMSISFSVATIGGQKASESATGRTISP